MNADPTTESGIVRRPDAAMARPKTDRETAVKTLSSAVTAGLGGAFEPADVVFVPDLPRTRSMKLMRCVVRTAWLGGEAGDLGTLVNPEAVQAIRDARPKTKS
jgi:acetyl-CoA synthetase